MTTTHDERFHEIERRYHDAVSHYFDDMRRARTVAQTYEIEEHYYHAENAYNAALERALIGNSDMIEEVVKGLIEANAEVERLRAEGEALSRVLKGMAKAVGLATRLVLIAS